MWEEKDKLWEELFKKNTEFHDFENSVTPDGK